MAVIFQFRDYSPSPLSRSLSQQAGDVVSQLYVLEENINNIGDYCDSIKEVQHAFCSHLDRSLQMLEESREFSVQCLAACELETIEKMEEKRGQLFRGKLTKMIL